MNRLLMKRYVPILLLYAVIISVLYAQVVFFSKSLLPSLYYPRGSTGTEGCTGRTPAPSHNIDLAAAAYELQPVNRVVGDIYRSGKIPLWNPYQGCGLPLAAQYSTRVFFPYQIIEDLCPWWSWDFFMLGRLVLAGFFTFIFLQLLGLSVPVSFLGGAFYMLSGSMTWFINNEQFVNVAMTLPMAMACLQNLSIRPDKCGTVLLSLAVCLVLLAGQPEIAFYSMLLLAAYGLFLSVQQATRAQGTMQFAGFSLLSLVLAIALSGLLLIPFVENVFHSYSTHPFGIRSGPIDHANINYVAAIFLPLLTELPNFFDYFPHNGVWDNLGGYSGIAALFLVVAGFFVPKIKRSKYFLFFSVAGILVLLKNFDFFLVSWISNLPLFNQAWSPRWAGPVWTFSFACAASISLAMFLEGKYSKKSVWLAASLCVAGIGLLLFALFRYHNGYVSSFFSVVSDRLKGITVPSYHFNDVKAFYVTYVAAAVCLVGALVYLLGYHKDRKQVAVGIVVLSIAELWLCIPRGMDLNWMPLRVAPFFVVVLSVVLLSIRKNAFTYAGLGLAAILSVAIDLSSPHGMPDRCDPFQKEPFVDFLQAQGGLFRIAGGEGLLMPNFAGVYRLSDVRFIAALLPEQYYAFTNEYLLQKPHEAPTDRLWFTGVPDVYKENPSSIYDDFMSARSYYSFLGVRYILAGPEMSLPLPLIYDRDIRIYENREAWPRIFMTNRVVYAHTRRQAQAFIGNKKFYPGQAVAAEESIPGRYLSGGTAGTDDFSIVDYKPNRVDIEGTTDRGGLLVLTDVFFPGWRALVDGRPVPILRINGLVRGILVDAGTHRIIFKYTPCSFLLGMGISLSAALACCALWFTNRKDGQLTESR